jgi:hypothetical protein
MFDVNPHEFLFTDLPEIFDESDLAALMERLTQYKADADSFITNLKQYLIDSVQKLLHIGIEGSLCGRLAEWYEQLSDRTKKNVFQADVNKFMKNILQNEQFDDMVLMTRLAKDIEMIPLEDWNDALADKFLEDIRQILEIVENFNQQSDAVQGNHVAIALQYGDQRYEKNMEDTEIGGLAETVLNNIETTFEDYAESISAQERIAVLLKLLKKEIDQM